MLTIEETKKIAELARLEIDALDLPKFQTGLSQVLEYVDELKKVDTEGILELAQVTGLENVFRPDEVQQLTPPEELFENTSEVKDGYIKVKAIL